MENLFANINDKTKINLALSYENSDIIDKFSSEYGVENDLAKEYFIEIKKFLYLCSNSTEKLAPSPEIDKIWHTFILFTKEYRLYCINFLGKFIDHVPEVNKGVPTLKENYLLNTITNYINVFGTLNNNVWQVEFKDETQQEESDRSSDCSNCNSGCSNCSSCEPSEHSCVYTGNCYSCTDSGQSCVGENPNDL